MGCCSIREKYINDDINTHLIKEQETNNDIIMIVLGTKGSGKSTFLNQLQRIYNDDYHSDIDKDSLVKKIRKGMLRTMMYLLQIMGDSKPVEILKSLSLENPDNLDEIAEIMQNAWITYNKFQHILSQSYLYKDGFIFNEHT